MTGLQTLLLWICVAIAIALVAGFDAVVVWTNANSGMASWAQAVFSVLAILAAGWIATFQTRQTERSEAERRRIERLGRLYGVSGVIAYVNACFVLGHDYVRDGSDPHDWGKLKDEIEQTRSVMNSLPVLDLPGPTLAIRLALLDQNLRTVHTLAGGNIEAQTDDVRIQVLDWFKEVCRQGRDAANWCDTEIRKIATPAELAEASEMHVRVNDTSAHEAINQTSAPPRQGR
jgi:hypothetical protein